MRGRGLDRYRRLDHSPDLAARNSDADALPDRSLGRIADDPRVPGAPHDRIPTVKGRLRTEDGERRAVSINGRPCSGDPGGRDRIEARSQAFLAATAVDEQSNEAARGTVEQNAGTFPGLGQLGSWPKAVERAAFRVERQSGAAEMP